MPRIVIGYNPKRPPYRGFHPNGLRVARQQITGSVRVAMHRGNQCLDGIELLHASESLDEVDRDVLPVEIGLFIEHECLDRAVTAREGGVRPHRHGRTIAQARLEPVHGRSRIEAVNHAA